MFPFFSLTSKSTERVRDIRRTPCLSSINHTQKACLDVDVHTQNDEGKKNED